MNRWNTFTDKISRRYKKYLNYFNVSRNFTRLRLHRYHFPDPPKVHITCTGATDGGCAQLARQLSTISFAHAFGFTYVHTPLSHVGHNVNNDPEWPEKWENFLQFSRFGKDASDIAEDFKVARNMNVLLPAIIRRKKESGNQYYQIRHCHPFTNKVPQAYLQITDKLRESYRQNGRSLNLIYDKNSFNVAIHVRRDDVSKNNEPNRFTSTQKLKGVIQKIQRELEHTDHSIFIFCIQLDEDLKKLEDDRVRVLHELDIFDVLDHLVHADLLVSSKSMVGYVSGILNEGIIIYEPFWHPPLPGWLNMDENFESKLEMKLARYLENKT